MSSNKIDTRWKFLSKRSWRCSNCEEAHEGIMDLATNAPDSWPDKVAYSPNSAVAGSTHFLSEDFCVVEGRDYFVRCVLEIPLIDSDGDRFGFGVWSSLSRKNFDIYVRGFDNGDHEDAGPWFGWFSNDLKCYPSTLNLKCMVHPQPGRSRPRIELEPTDHPLAVESRVGISYDRLIEIFAANGHPVIQPES